MYRTSIYVAGLCIVVAGVLVAANGLLGEEKKPAKAPAPEATLRAALDQLAVARKALEAGDKKAALAALEKAQAKVTAAHVAIRPRVINTKCPLMGGAVDPKKVAPALYRRHKDKGVGFCCPGCPAAWDKLTNAEKQAKLKAVAPPAHEHKATPEGTPYTGHEAARPAVVNAMCPVMGTAINPKNVPANLYRQYKGRGVGFCCPGCPVAWDKLTDAEKEAKLKAAVATE